MCFGRGVVSCVSLEEYYHYTGAREKVLLFVFKEIILIGAYFTYYSNPRQYLYLDVYFCGVSSIANCN